MLKPRVRTRALENEGSVAVHVVWAPPTQEGSLDRSNNLAGRIDDLRVACMLVLVISDGYAINVNAIADEDGLRLADFKLMG